MFYFLAAEFQNILNWGWVPFQQLQVFWYLTVWTATTFSDFLWEQLFFQQLVEFFADHQINHYPVDLCEHNWPHCWVSGLSGGWYYWFNPATASTWELKFNYCYHLTGEAIWKVSVYLVCIIDVDINLSIEK